MLNKTIQIKIDKAIRLLQNNSEEALKIFNEILKNEPDNIDALNGKGSALMKLNRFNDAEKCFDKSLSISENIAALINKGIILKIISIAFLPPETNTELILLILLKINP